MAEENENMDNAEIAETSREGTGAENTGTADNAGVAGGTGGAADGGNTDGAGATGGNAQNLLRGEPQAEAEEERENEAVVDRRFQRTVGARDGDGLWKCRPVKPHRFGRRFTDNHDLILECLNNCEQITDIAKKFGSTRMVMSQYIRSTDDLREAYEDAQEKRLDLMENVVLTVATTDSETEMTENGAFSRHDGRILMANLNAAKFWLERLGGARGWNAKIETNEVGNGGNRVPMIFLGDVSEATIAEAEARINAANKEAGVEP